MSPLLGLLNIGTTELIIVIVVAIMLFGGDLPDVARKAARYVGKLRGMADDLSRELRQSEHARAVDLSREVRDIDAAVRQAGDAPAQAAKDLDEAVRQAGEPGDARAHGADGAEAAETAEAADTATADAPVRPDGKPAILPTIEAGRDPFADDPLSAPRDAGTFDTEDDGGDVALADDAAPRADEPGVPPNGDATSDPPRAVPDPEPPRPSAPRDEDRERPA